MRERALADLERDIQFNEMFVGILGDDLRSPLLGDCDGLQPAREAGRTLRGATEERRYPLESDEPDDADGLAVARRDAEPLGRRDSHRTPSLRFRRRRAIPSLRSSSSRIRIAGSFSSARARSTVISTPIELAQVVSNLVSNAASYGGGATVVLVRVTASADEARLGVHNGGKPIAPDVLPTMISFLLDIRGRHDIEARGLGLGLDISLQYCRGARRKEFDVELHGCRRHDVHRRRPRRA